MGKLSDVCGTRVVLAGAGVAWLGLAVPAAPLEVELLLLLLLLLGLLVGALRNAGRIGPATSETMGYSV